MLLMAVLFFGVKSSFDESPLGGKGYLMRSYLRFYCAHTSQRPILYLGMFNVSE